jgi:hypothetical protein
MKRTSNTSDRGGCIGFYRGGKTYTPHVPPDQLDFPHQIKPQGPQALHLHSFNPEHHFRLLRWRGLYRFLQGWQNLYTPYYRTNQWAQSTPHTMYQLPMPGTSINTLDIPTTMFRSPENMGCIGFYRGGKTYTPPTYTLTTEPIDPVVPDINFYYQ